MAHTRHSFLGTYGTAVMLAFATITSVVTGTAATCIHVVQHVWYEARDWAVDLFKAAVRTFRRPELWLPARAVEQVQACAYALRMAKRERPHVRDTWRMCPSI